MRTPPAGSCTSASRVAIPRAAGGTGGASSGGKTRRAGIRQTHVTWISKVGSRYDNRPKKNIVIEKYKVVAKSLYVVNLQIYSQKFS